jgi:phage terminase small subunit
VGLKILTEQHKKFVRCYIEGFKPGVGFNATQAAINAGYSKNHADKKGSELKNDPLIQAEIERTQKRIEERTLVRMSDIVTELCKIGFANIREFLDDDGNIIPLEKLPEHTAAAIAEYTEKRIEGKDGQPDVVHRKIKLADKRSAMMDVAKLQGYLKDKGEQPAPVAFVMNLRGKHGSD